MTRKTKGSGDRLSAHALRPYRLGGHHDGWPAGDTRTGLHSPPRTTSAPSDTTGRSKPCPTRHQLQTQPEIGPPNSTFSSSSRGPLAPSRSRSRTHRHSTPRAAKRRRPPVHVVPFALLPWEWEIFAWPRRQPPPTYPGRASRMHDAAAGWGLSRRVRAQCRRTR